MDKVDVSIIIPCPNLWYNLSMKIIQLTRGATTKVDDVDYRKLLNYKWHLNGEGYAASGTKNKGVPQLMHRIIFDNPRGWFIDHINEDKLDNRRNNLRLCSNRQNLSNRGKQKNNTSGYKGVTWLSANKVWIAQIKVNGKNIYLGSFKDKEDAASCRWASSIEIHGDFAHE